MAVSVAGVGGAASTVSRPGPLASAAITSAGTVAPGAAVVAGASSGGATVAVQQVAGDRPEANAPLPRLPAPSPSSLHHFTR